MSLHTGGERVVDDRSEWQVFSGSVQVGEVYRTRAGYGWRARFVPDGSWGTEESAGEAARRTNEFLTSALPGARRRDVEVFAVAGGQWDFRIGFGRLATVQEALTDLDWALRAFFDARRKAGNEPRQQ